MDELPTKGATIREAEISIAVTAMPDRKAVRRMKVLERSIKVCCGSEVPDDRKGAVLAVTPLPPSMPALTMPVRAESVNIAVNAIFAAILQACVFIINVLQIIILSGPSQAL
jgi:hypothetical protein